MLSHIKKVDSFTRNIIIVFAGTSLVNFFGLLYQLLIAHKLSPPDFAAFNSLLVLYTMIAAPIGTLQMAVAKFSAEFKAKNELDKIRVLLSGLFKWTGVAAFFTLLVLFFFSPGIVGSLKIPSLSSALLFTFLVASSWIIPVLSGGVQGLELFGWLTAGSICASFLKLALAALFVLAGFGISGALGALLASNVAIIIFYDVALRRQIGVTSAGQTVDFKSMLVYCFPVALSYFCFNALTGFDMVLVRSFFTVEQSGFYSLAQMLGKIFLFLPGAISIVMFPRSSGLSAQNKDTLATLKRSLGYMLTLSIFAVCLYNIFPQSALKILTGKSFSESVLLGRLFSVSMTFFSMLFILINYFLSVADFRFIKYIVVATLLQTALIFTYHNSLVQVQLVLCLSSVALCLIHLWLAFKKD